MSTRPQLSPFHVISDGDMTLTLTSEVTIVQKISMPSYQVEWVGTAPVGVVMVEGSNTYELNPDGSVRDAGRWTAMYFSVNGGPPTATMPVAGATGDGLIDIETSVYAIRLTYTPTSGTGTFNATIAGKVS